MGQFDFALLSSPLNMSIRDGSKLDIWGYIQVLYLLSFSYLISIKLFILIRVRGLYFRFDKSHVRCISVRCRLR